LGLQAITSLLQYLPTPEETTLLQKALSSGTDKLAKAEEYLLEMAKVIANLNERVCLLHMHEWIENYYYLSQIRNCEDRLTAMSICLSASEAMQQVTSNSEIIVTAANEVSRD